MFPESYQTDTNLCMFFSKPLLTISRQIYNYKQGKYTQEARQMHMHKKKYSKSKVVGMQINNNKLEKQITA